MHVRIWNAVRCTLYNIVYSSLLWFAWCVWQHAPHMSLNISKILYFCVHTFWGHAVCLWVCECVNLLYFVCTIAMCTISVNLCHFRVLSSLNEVIKKTNSGSKPTQEFAMPCFCINANGTFFRIYINRCVRVYSKKNARACLCEEQKQNVVHNLTKYRWAAEHFLDLLQPRANTYAKYRTENGCNQLNIAEEVFYVKEYGKWKGTESVKTKLNTKMQELLHTINENIYKLEK